MFINNPAQKKSQWQKPSGINIIENKQCNIFRHCSLITLFAANTINPSDNLQAELLLKGKMSCAGKHKSKYLINTDNTFRDLRGKVW